MGWDLPALAILTVAVIAVFSITSTVVVVILGPIAVKANSPVLGFATLIASGVAGALAGAFLLSAAMATAM